MTAWLRRFGRIRIWFWKINHKDHEREQIMGTSQEMKQTWEVAFGDAIQEQAFNTAPVEALVRTIAYFLRTHHQNKNLKNLHFLEMGCGAGPNLLWLAKKGIKVSGVDIAPTVVALARQILEENKCGGRIGKLLEASVTQVPWPDESFDGILEACVFQHLDREDREKTFGEVRRLLKPGGIFVGYLLDVGHTVYQTKCSEERPEDPGTLILKDGTSNLHLTNIGLCHFYRKEEFYEYFKGFSIVDPCLTTYYLPKEEAKKRGYPEYLQSMWTVYAVK